LSLDSFSNVSFGASRFRFIDPGASVYRASSWDRLLLAVRGQASGGFATLPITSCRTLKNACPLSHCAQTTLGGRIPPDRKASANRPRCRQGLVVSSPLELAFGLNLRGGEWAKDGKHRIEVGQPGAKAVDEIAQREISLEEIFMVVIHIRGQLAHQRRVHLF
jgi:hypothetical protein